MQIKMSVPKEKIDAMLKQKVDDLTKENAKLKRKNTELEKKFEEHKQLIEEAKKIYKEMKSVCNEWATHDWCQDL
jgi:hypothetical protein